MTAAPRKQPRLMRARERLARISESFESRLWPIPVAAVVVAVIAGILLPRIDLQVDGSLPDSIDSLIFNGGADTARAVLSSIAGSLITATSLTFSLTVVALQLASSQASPRVMRLFARDGHVHRTLAVFLGTFAYSITALRSVRSADQQVVEFVPRITVTVGFLLTLVSVVVLVFFLAHLATQLRVETIMREIHTDTEQTIRLVSDSNASLTAFASPVVRPESTTHVLSPSSGFLTSRDRGTLLAFATSRSIVVEELARIGDNVVTGTPLARWWVSTGESGDNDGAVDAAEVEDVVQRSLRISYERTAAQDVDYGVQQLVDIALRALSPGINDPTTASNVLGHLGAILTRTIGMPQLPKGIADAAGQLRIVTDPRSETELLRLALSQIRHYGATDPQLVKRFLQVLSDLTYTSGGFGIGTGLKEQLDALEQQLREAAPGDPAAVAILLQECANLRPRLNNLPADALAPPGG